MKRQHLDDKNDVSKEDITDTKSKEPSCDVTLAAAAGKTAETSTKVIITKPPAKNAAASGSSGSDESEIEDDHKNEDSKQDELKKINKGTKRTASTILDASSTPKSSPARNRNNEESSVESEDSLAIHKEDKDITEFKPVSTKRKPDSDNKDVLTEEEEDGDEEEDDDDDSESETNAGINKASSDRSPEKREKRRKEKHRAILSKQSNKAQITPVASSPIATATTPAQRLDSSTYASNLGNVTMGLSNSALQLPVSSQTMLSANTPVIGGLTGQNADLFMQGYAAAQQVNAQTNAHVGNPMMSNLNVTPNNMFNIPSFHVRGDKRLKREGTSDAYRDFSRIPRSLEEEENAPARTTGKDPPFPIKLHRILSNPEYSDLISWLPHGRSWRVLKPKAFEEKIVPRYFRHTKYASFMRQVGR